MANPNDEQLLSQIASNQKKQRVGFILTPILFFIAMGIIMAGISTIIRRWRTSSTGWSKKRTYPVSAWVLLNRWKSTTI